MWCFHVFFKCFVVFSGVFFKVFCGVFRWVFLKCFVVFSGVFLSILWRFQVGFCCCCFFVVFNKRLPWKLHASGVFIRGNLNLNTIMRCDLLINFSSLRFTWLPVQKSQWRQCIVGSTQLSCLGTHYYKSSCDTSWHHLCMRPTCVPVDPETLSTEQKTTNCLLANCLPELFNVLTLKNVHLTNLGYILQALKYESYVWGNGCCSHWFAWFLILTDQMFHKNWH